jgi:DNA polymerase III subunit delta
VKLGLEQLKTGLSKGLHPVYMVAGDEPFQLGEAMDAVRVVANAQGYSSREIFSVESGFKWFDFAAASESYSLFGDKRILDVRFSAKPDKEASQTLVHYAAQMPDDALLLLTLPRLSNEDLKKSAWFTALEPRGVFVQVWPLHGKDLMGWLEQRMSHYQMLADRSGLSILAARIEGNLLAADQELRKLFVLYGATRVDDDMMRQAVADSARYDVYDLTDAALSGSVARTSRILACLRAEGIAGAVVLWALTREIRALADLALASAQGENVESVCNRLRIWNPRKGALIKALQRSNSAHRQALMLASAKTDRIIKGMENGSVWDALLNISLALAGMPQSLMQPTELST